MDATEKWDARRKLGQMLRKARAALRKTLREVAEGAWENPKLSGNLSRIERGKEGIGLERFNRLTQTLASGIDRARIDWGDYLEVAREALGPEGAIVGSRWFQSTYYDYETPILPQLPTPTSTEGQSRFSQLKYLAEALSDRTTGNFRLSFVYYRGAFSEASTEQERAEALLGQAFQLWHLSRYTQAKNKAEEILSRREEIPKPIARWAYQLLGQVDFRRGRIGSATSYFAQARETGLNCGDAVLQWQADHWYARCLFEKGTLPEPVVWREVAVSGSLEEAENILEKSVNISSRLGLEEGHDRRILARCQLLLENEYDARKNREKAKAILDSRVHIAHIHLDEGRIALANGDNDAAVWEFRNALDIHWQVGYAKGVAEALSGLAQCASDRTPRLARDYALCSLLADPDSGQKDSMMMVDLFVDLAQDQDGLTWGRTTWDRYVEEVSNLRQKGSWPFLYLASLESSPWKNRKRVFKVLSQALRNS